jgi:signal peptidase II
MWLGFKKFLRTYWFLFLVSGLIIILDQATKSYIRANFVENVDMWAPWPWLLPYARIVHITNTGVAFGMFQNMNLIFAVLAAIVSLAIIYYYPQVAGHDWLLRIALGMQLAGAVGNLIDRILQGYVTDFISIAHSLFSMSLMRASLWELRCLSWGYGSRSKIKRRTPRNQRKMPK